MERELLKFGGGVGQTILNPLVALIVLVVGVWMVLSPRNKGIAPYLAAAILIPTDQVLVVGSLHFTMQRVLILFGIARIIRMKTTYRFEAFSGGMNRLDGAMISWALVTAVSWVLLWQNSATVIYQLGELYSVFGGYILLRCLIRTEQDIQSTIRIFAALCLVCALIMVFEQAAGRNPYAYIGGARAASYASSLQRDDRFRASGPFAHPILAGTFAVVLIPLFFGLWWSNRKHRAWAVTGIITATVMAFASNSSTPLLAYIAALFGLALWPLRGLMRVFRWMIVIALVTLHLTMKAPVWHLISRIDISGGSSSYHRYALVDQFIRHFSDWWLVGVKNNGQWGWDMWDTANQYVAVGQTSGLLSFCLFIAIIVYGFKYAGRARQAAGADRKRALLVWSLGCALFAQTVGFFGISYFDQTTIAWHCLLALISASLSICPSPGHELQPQPVQSIFKPEPSGSVWA